MRAAAPKHFAHRIDAAAAVLQLSLEQREKVIQSLDTNQIEAAEDLGAPWWRIHQRVILPHAKPGIASGSVMVFMLCAGSLLVPTLLGSTSAQWFTQTIQQWMLEALDWNTGAAYAFMLLILCTVFVSVVMRIFRVKLSDIAK